MKINPVLLQTQATAKKIEDIVTRKGVETTLYKTTSAGFRGLNSGNFNYTNIPFRGYGTEEKQPLNDKSAKNIRLLQSMISSQIPKCGENVGITKDELNNFALFFDNTKLSKNCKNSYLSNNNGTFYLTQIAKVGNNEVIYPQQLFPRKNYGQDIHFFEDKYRYENLPEKEIAATNSRYLRELRPSFINSQEGDLSLINFKIPQIKDRPLKIAFVSFDPRSEDKRSLSVGVNYLEGALKEKFGDKINILCLDDQISHSDEIKSRLKEFQPDLIGVSSKIHTYNKSSPFIDYCKSEFPDSFVLMGGTTASCGFTEVLDDHPDIAICAGNGQNNMCAVTEILLGEKSKEDIFNVPNIVLKQKDGKLITAKQETDDLDIAPTDTNLKEILAKKGTINLRMSQGCWGHCTFCTQPEKWESAKIDNVISILKDWKKDHGVSSVIFTDDEMVPKSPENAYKQLSYFTDRLLEEDLNINWYINLRADAVGFLEGEKGDALIEKLKKSKCAGFFVGIESGSDKQLKRYAKQVYPQKTNVEINKRIIEKLSSKGIPVSVGYIMTDPLMPTMSELRENMQFFEDNDLFSFQSRLNNSMRVNRGTNYVKMISNMDIGLLGPLQPNLTTYDSRYLDPRVGIVRDSLDIFIEEVRPEFEAVYTAILRSKLNPNDPKQQKLKGYEKDLKYITYDYLKDMVLLFPESDEDRLIDNSNLRDFDKDFWTKRRGRLTEEVNGKVPELCELRQEYKKKLNEKIDEIQGEIN